MIPGSELDTSRAPAGVREQLSFTGRDTAINQENWLTALQASYRYTKIILQFVLPRKKGLNTAVITLFCSGVLYFTLAGRPPG